MFDGVCDDQSVFVSIFCQTLEWTQAPQSFSETDKISIHNRKGENVRKSIFVTCIIITSVRMYLILYF